MGNSEAFSISIMSDEQWRTLVMNDERGKLSTLMRRAAIAVIGTAGAFYLVFVNNRNPVTIDNPTPVLCVTKLPAAQGKP